MNVLLSGDVEDVDHIVLNASARAHPHMVTTQADALDLVILDEVLTDFDHCVCVVDIDFPPLWPIATQPELTMAASHSCLGEITWSDSTHFPQKRPAIHRVDTHDCLHR